MSTPSSARDRILARLAKAAPPPRPAPEPAAWYAANTRNEGLALRADRFQRLIEAAHAEVHRVSEANWTDTLASVLAARGIARLLLAPGTGHGERAASDLAGQGIQPLAYDRPAEAWKAELFNDVPASLTAARGAIAETGTLILWPDAHEPRLMSLVPPVHVVLLDASRIHATFFDVMRDEGWSAGLPTNALLVSGPSKTADIQQTLAYGAHGPKELIVLLKGDWQ